MQVIPYQAGDHHAVQAFLTREFPESPHKADSRYFEWRFAGHPLGSSLPDYLLAWEERQLVGQMAALRDRLRVDGVWRDCLWLVDLMVTPEKRGSLTALRLFQAAMQRSELLLAVGAGAQLLPLYRTLGWKLLPVAGTYFSVARLSGLLQLAGSGEAKSPPWNGVAPLADPACSLLQAAAAIGGSRFGVSIHEIEAVGDDLIEELIPLVGTTTFRSDAMLRWKFQDRPVGRHVILGASAKGRLRGYAVLKLMRRGNVRWAEVADFLTPPAEPAVLRELLREAIRRCRALEADFVRLRCSHPAYLPQLRKPFWIRRNRPVIDDVLYFTRDKSLAARLEASPWHLTSVVSDRSDHGRDEWT